MWSFIRLSEDPTVSVLLLEAGGDGNLISNIPYLVGLALDSSMDWGYMSHPDGRACLGMIGGQCKWHRGKVLGGTSAMNGMMYIRGKFLTFFINLPFYKYTVLSFFQGIRLTMITGHH
jgi:choline dehydrogenase-like flavoprotein